MQNTLIHIIVLVLDEYVQRAAQRIVDSIWVPLSPTQLFILFKPLKS